MTNVLWCVYTKKEPQCEKEKKLQKKRIFFPAFQFYRQIQFSDVYNTLEYWEWGLYDGCANEILENNLTFVSIYDV